MFFLSVINLENIKITRGLYGKYIKNTGHNYVIWENSEIIGYSQIQIAVYLWNNSENYILFKLHSNGKNHFGWIKISILNNTLLNIIEYAIEK